MRKGQRDIGNILVFLGLILFTMVAYNTWFKQKDLSLVPPQAPLQESVAPSSQTDPALSITPSEPLPVEPTVPDLSEARPPEPGELPASPHATTLAAIRTLIEQKKEAEAEAKLTTLPQEISDDPELKSFVAILWNNLGVLQKQTRGAAASIQAYQAGLALDPESRALNLNLAHAYWESQDPGLTVEFLEHLVELAPNDGFPHLALADRLYGKDDLAGATRHLEVATQLATGDPGLRSYLKFVTEKVKGAEQTERKFLARKSSHFVVKFDGEEDYAIWDEVLGILEDAYRDIGQKLEYFPSRPIHVVLVTREQFVDAAGTPAWADALFDPVLGRIKIPTQGALTDRAWLARVLRHEFVHALIHERMGLQAGAVPTWLNEGLAMQLAGDPWPDIDQIARGPELKLIPLGALHGGWGRLPRGAAVWAYLEGNSATHYMIDRFGMRRVTEILDLLKAGHTIEGAIHDKLMMSYKTFQRQWTITLEDKMAATGS